MKKITQTQYYAVLGLITTAISARRKLDELEEHITEYLKELGAKGRDGSPYDVKNDVGEAVYNEGDNPPEATKTLLKHTSLEVEDA